MTDADGIALAFWVLVLAFGALVAAGALEWLLSRTDRRWIRRLQQIERGREAMRAEGK